MPTIADTIPIFLSSLYLLGFLVSIIIIAHACSFVKYFFRAFLIKWGSWSHWE
nr:MAG TPA: hypothetical protein [Caudoviricetes sp.]